MANEVAAKNRAKKQEALRKVTENLARWDFCFDTRTGGGYLIYIWWDVNQHMHKGKKDGKKGQWKQEDVHLDWKLLEKKYLEIKKLNFWGKVTGVCSWHSVSITPLPYSHPAVPLDQCLASLQRGDMIRVAWEDHRKDRMAQRKSQAVPLRFGRDVGGFLSLVSLERQAAFTCRQNDFCRQWVCSVEGTRVGKQYCFSW